MRRKYDLRNKRNFMIIMILMILIVVIFSLFIYKYRHAAKIVYTISSDSILQDENKNFITVNSDSALKVRWNGNYYLVYQDSKVNLGKKVIAYNMVTGKIKLYGKMYEIDASGKINATEGETELATTDNKFYKLADREYLLVDRKIISDDNSIDASSYLLVELDKMGNAKLSNNKLNLKTINPTVLRTSDYTFDIANEILKYSDLEIDLKKVIGTTNQYKEDKKEDDDEKQNDGNNDGSQMSTSSTQVVSNGSGNGSTLVTNNNDGDVSSIEEIKDKTKMTSVIRPQTGISSIDIDYVIYDPYNEYKSVYAEITKNNKVETVYLSKTDTHVVFEGLIPNKEYNIKFIYTTVDDDTGEVILHKFDDLTLKTKMPNYSIAVYKINSVDKIEVKYKVYLDTSYKIDSVKVSMTFDYRKKLSDDTTSIVSETVVDTLSVDTNSSVLVGTFDVSEYDIVSGSVIDLNIDSVSNENGTLVINSSSPFKYGR